MAIPIPIQVVSHSFTISIPNFVTNSHYHGNPMGFPFPLGIPFPWSSLVATQWNSGTTQDWNWGPRAWIPSVLTTRPLSHTTELHSTAQSWQRPLTFSDTNWDAEYSCLGEHSHQFGFSYVFVFLDCMPHGAYKWTYGWRDRKEQQKQPIETAAW